jgi:hypothetical protein
LIGIVLVGFEVGNLLTCQPMDLLHMNPHAAAAAAAANTAPL